MERATTTPKQIAGSSPVAIDADDHVDDEIDWPQSSTRIRLSAFLTNPYLTLISRFVLGSIFILSGSTKVGNPLAFADSIRSYEIPMPEVVVSTMATVLPVLELGLGIWILVGLFTRFSASVASGLMVIFMLAIAQAWARGIEADCGCFAGGEGTTTFAQNVMAALGPVGTFLSDEQIGPVPLIRDFAFLLMALHLVLVPTLFSLDQLRSREGQEVVLPETE